MKKDNILLIRKGDLEVAESEIRYLFLKEIRML